MCQPTVVVTTTVSAPLGNLAVDATNIYFTQGNSVVQATLVGGIITTLTSTANSPAYTAVDASSVYWLEGGVGNVNKIPIGGGTTKNLVSAGTPLGEMLIDSTNSYYILTYSAAVDAVPLTGGSPTAFFSATSQFLNAYSFDSSNVYWSQYDGSIYSTVYQKARGADAGSAVLLVGSLACESTDVRVDTAQVYVGCGGAVTAVPIGGGSSKTLVPSYVDHLFLDGTYVYWSDGTGKKVSKIPKTGGTATTLAQTSPGAPGSLVVDTAYVYWANWDGTTASILKTPK